MSEEPRVNIQLDTSEVQVAVTEYLRKRGVVVSDPRQVRLDILDPHGGRMSIAGCTPVVVAQAVELPAEPYR